MRKTVGGSDSNNFDGLRLIGALLVLLSHQFALQGHAEPRLFTYTGGAIGVAMFFAMSGFLVTKSWRTDPHILRFAARRMLRVWPALVLVVVVLSIWARFYMVERHDSLPGILFDIAGEHFLSNALFMHFDWSFFQGQPHEDLNGPLWTIPYEVSLYACFAIGGALLALPRRFAAVFVVFGLVYLCGVFAGPYGIQAFVLFKDFSRWISLGTMFGVGVAMQLWPRRGWILGVLLALWLPLLLVCVFAVWAGQRSWAGLRSAGHFGDFSYGLYLWAWPITQAGVMIFGIDQPVIVWSLPATFAVAWLSWNLLERPALRLKPSAALAVSADR